MKGLLQKDFYLMRTLARSYAFILGVFFLLSLTGVYDGTFLCTFLVLMCVMIPANTFSYDEQAKWDKYAASLPAGRPGVVRAKYLFTLLVSLAALALAALLQALLFFLGRHLFFAFQTVEADLGASGTDRGARYVYGHIPAAYDNGFAFQPQRLIKVHISQEFHAG